MINRYIKGEIIDVLIKNMISRFGLITAREPI